ncbi:MAG: Triosephosphate isomerase [Glaciecola sp. HTCC2999]|nr:MAG: Triosephosphate isomerase [Glaciecola sp. HTCC2999]
MSRVKIIAGNWKLNGNKALVDEFNHTFNQTTFEHVSVMIFPPALYVNEFNCEHLTIGVQNVSEQTSGAFTGELSVDMLNDMGITHTLIGHSERRDIYNETNELIAAKVAQAIAVNITPVLCIGESLETRNAGNVYQFIQSQLDSVIEVVGITGLAKCVIAYEPIWAIGTGVTASPEQAQEVHRFIRDYLGSIDEVVAESLSILYGGSVNAKTASELFVQPDIDGGLVGGASLKKEEFLTICHAANQRG